jgi:hypothetical protein
LSFGKRILVGAESRKDKWDPFDWRPSWLGVGMLCPFWTVPGICLTTEEKHGKPESG